MGGRSRGETIESTKERLTVHDAAQALDVSEATVRKRVKRGTLKSEREGDRLYVFLTPRTNAAETNKPRGVWSAWVPGRKNQVRDREKEYDVLTDDCVLDDLVYLRDKAFR
jgi:hypothetical protein